MNGNCSRCGQPLEPGGKHVFLEQGFVCGDCLAKAAEEFQSCPNCGELLTGGEHEVGLVLTAPGSSSEMKSRAPEVLVIVCPKCHILFFDKFTYEVLQNLK